MRGSGSLDHDALTAVFEAPASLLAPLRGAGLPQDRQDPADLRLGGDDVFHRDPVQRLLGEGVVQLRGGRDRLLHRLHGNTSVYGIFVLIII